MTAQNRRPPNILLITCDQLRAFELGCYGNPTIRTPHMDRLAREGFRFEHAVTNYPVCMAARSVLLSGQYNRTCTGGVSNVAYPGRPGEFAMPEYPDYGRPHLPDQTLAECLRDAGYSTAVIGKWHIHSWPHDVGFEKYLIPRVHHCHTGQSYTENGGPEFVPEGYSVDYEAAQVEQHLRRRADERRPFFLYYNISPPHCPLADAPAHYLRMYEPAAIPIRGNVDPGKRLANESYWFRVYRYDFRYYSLHLPYTAELPPGYDLRSLIAEYYGMTTWADDALGRVLRALEETGLADDTLVIFTSDHGDNLGSHGLVQKGTPNEEAIRIPLLLWSRGLGIQGASARVVASLVDVAPTILELARVEVPRTMQGRSLVQDMRGETDASRWAVVETDQGVALRTPTHMCFVPFEASTRSLASRASRLFALDEDPLQMRNLAGLPEHAAIESHLTDYLRDWDATTPWMDVHGPAGTPRTHSGQA